MPKGVENSEREAVLVNALGQETAQVLMQIYGGSRLYIPRCQLAMTELRNQAFFAEIERDISRGSSQTAAIQHHAPRFGFTERWAYELLSKKRQDHRKNRVQQGFLLSLGHLFYDVWR